MTERLIDWENRLIEYISSVVNQPFEYGKQDCSTFFCDAIQAMTGKHPAPEYIGKYSSLIGGLKMIKAAGFESHVDFFASKFPIVENPVLAQRGDGAIITDDAGNIAMGIVQGEFVYVMGENGLGLVPITEIVKVLKT